MDLKKQLGFDADVSNADLVDLANLKLAARGRPLVKKGGESTLLRLSTSLLANLREKNRLLADFLPAVDQRVQDFLDDVIGECFEERVPTLPTDALTLERHGLARVLSVPADADKFTSDIVESCRVKQGVLHNPKHDRRTTKGSFHIAEHGFAIPGDKVAVPKVAFARLYEAALKPPADLLRLPFTSAQEDEAKLFVSLLLRPLVIPEVPGFTSERRMEVRFFAPGNLVSNLDFVESIFGNGGDPYLAENNSALDPEGWTGTTGCVILAPHLLELKKKDLGLPHVSEATERQKRDGMCWESEDECYNDGSAFKITCRDHRGVVITLIADNYFGYCKKEVKTQISYSANLFGLAEEEHAGGALAYPSWDLGETFRFDMLGLKGYDHTFDNVTGSLKGRIEMRPEGYAVDQEFPDIHYLPEDAHFDLQKQRIHWSDDGKEREIRLRPGIAYVLPSGYKVEMHKPAEGRRWRLVGTVPEGVFCHKPCTVSGGGKSEISKSIADAILHGPVFVNHFHRDFDQVEQIIYTCYGYRFKEESQNKGKESRPILSRERSLGSVIKLLTPSDDYTDEYNKWLRSIPFHIRDLVLLVKRYYKDDWGDTWRERFSVDEINGVQGNELKYRDNYIRSHYLRIGYNKSGAWRTFSLRKDFNPAAKVQTEDDITASVVVPQAMIEDMDPDFQGNSIKFAQNCEFRLFQRPDEAIHRGYDKQTEWDYSRDDVFFCNYHPMTREEALELTEDAIRFSQFTQPMQGTILDFLQAEKPEYVISSAHPRIVNGKPSKNPRYLQDRPDIVNPRAKYLADMGTRLFRRIPLEKWVPKPVDAVLAGRRMNPPDPETGIRPLCVYNPLHYQDLPELFMDFISSLTGKSPSTTGAGSEGALTKGPFNALPPIIDLNNALVSYLVTGQGGFSSAAGYIGPKWRVDHDISLLVPEIWSRMRPYERDPKWLIENEYLDRCQDFDHDGRKILASRLGWRINERFVRVFLGRVFSNPSAVFTADFLKPEVQDMDVFIDGMDNMVQTQQRVAQIYFDDGSIEMACPPLKALLSIMAKGEYEGKDVHHPDIQKMFTAEALFESDWYAERLKCRQKQERKFWERAVRDLEAFKKLEQYRDEAQFLGIDQRLCHARKRLVEIDTDGHLQSLRGTIGADPAVLA